MHQDTPRDPLLGALMDLAGFQHGVVTRAQALAAGLTARQVGWRVSSGRWVRCYPGVYLTRPGRADLPSVTSAAVLYAGQGAMVSHWSAAFDLGLVRSPPRAVHVVVAEARRVTASPGIVVHRCVRVAPSTPDVRRWPPRTSVEQTVLDVADLGTPDEAVAVAALACQLGLTWYGRLRAELDGRPRHDGERCWSRPWKTSAAAPTARSRSASSETWPALTACPPGGRRPPPEPGCTTWATTSRRCSWSWTGSPSTAGPSPERATSGATGIRPATAGSRFGRSGLTSPCTAASWRWTSPPCSSAAGGAAGCNRAGGVTAPSAGWADLMPEDRRQPGVTEAPRSRAHGAYPRPVILRRVAMRMSTLFLRTLREDPADAEVPSHRLLLRAGYIRRVSPGVYTWLPLGLRVLRRVERVVRQEMDAVGAQELLFPALLPREPYEATGRWTEYGDSIFRLQDRKGADHLLGPTHEELFTLTVKDLYSSYKDLPVTLYQIQNKYRDEARPRAGILRGREFVMKDAYSFDVDEAGLQKSYDQQREAYTRIFDRLGFHYVIVQAMSGAMGGSRSEEFLATAVNGEDTYVRCPNCGYAANVEALRVPVPPDQDYSDVPPAHAEDTPDTPTIATLVDHLDAAFPRDDRPWQASDTLKNVLLTVTSPDGSTQVLAIGLPGDREVDEKRLGAQLEPAVATVFEDFDHHPELVKGYIGPQALGSAKPAGVRYLVDPRVVTGTRWVTGADAPGRHVLDLVAGRDFTPDGTIEAADVRAGDECPSCGHPLETARGFEMGHIFQLGRKYAEALGLKVLDETGKLVTVTMGSYGVGVSRAVAAVAEGNHDELGLVWPREISPADVHVVATGKEDTVYLAAQDLVRQLERAGLEVLYDDRRQVSPGVKFKDSELIGVPTIVVVGRGLADGTVEVKDRRSGERRSVRVESAAAEVVAEVRGTGAPRT